MDFLKYQHIERWGTDEVVGIENGTCYIFPKLDGTNASLWMDNGVLRGGSRRREVSFENDNADFFNTVCNDERYINYFNKYPNHRLFGEWLVPHSLKTYRDDAWRKFYVFDVVIGDEDSHQYLHYEDYKEGLDEFNIDYIPPIAIITNPSEENIYRCLEKTGQFLIKDGEGNGEGIVIKNYYFVNKYGRTTWAKIVTNEFKEVHHKTMGAPILINESVEDKIVEKYCTKSFIEKEHSKIVNAEGRWISQYIPRLLSTVYHELINEEMWNIIKEFKNPTIDFKRLNMLIIQSIKKNMPELF